MGKQIHVEHWVRKSLTLEQILCLACGREEKVRDICKRGKEKGEVERSKERTQVGRQQIASEIGQFGSLSICVLLFLLAVGYKIVK